MPHIGILAPFDPRPGTSLGRRETYGGVERYTWALAKGLVARGWKVSVFTTGAASGEVQDGNPRVFAQPPILRPHGSVVFRWPLDVLEDSIDLIHVQATYPFLTEIAPLIARLAGIPSVVTYHFRVTPRKPGDDRLFRAYNALFGRSIRGYDRVIFTSEDYADAFGLRKQLRRSQVRIVPLGVDPDLFRLDPAVPKRNQILFVGRLVHFKGLDFLLAAFEGFSRINPGWTLTLVGNGELRSSLLERIHRSEPRIRLLTDVDDEYLVRLYNESAVTVLPSLRSPESFGIVLVESIACGTPVIATDIPGVRRVAALGGLVVPPSDASSLTKALLRTTECPWSFEERVSRSEAVRGPFSWESITESTSEVYRELL